MLLEHNIHFQVNNIKIKTKRSTLHLLEGFFFTFTKCVWLEEEEEKTNESSTFITRSMMKEEVTGGDEWRSRSCTILHTFMIQKKPNTKERERDRFALFSSFLFRVEARAV